MGPAATNLQRGLEPAQTGTSAEWGTGTVRTCSLLDGLMWVHTDPGSRGRSTMQWTSSASCSRQLVPELVLLDQRCHHWGMWGRSWQEI